MPAAKKVTFIQTRPNNGDLTRFGLFRSVDGFLTHIMDERGMWVALPDDDDKAIALVQAMIAENKLPEWRVEEDGFIETADEVAAESSDVSDGQVPAG